MVRGLRVLYEQELRAVTVLLGYRDKNALSDIAIDKLRVGLGQVTDAQLRERVKELDIALARLSRTSRDETKGHEALIGSLDDSQLKAVMRTEFLRAAHTFTEEEWKVLDEVRMIQKRDGVRSAMIANRNGLRSIGYSIPHEAGSSQTKPPQRDDDDEDEDG